MNVSDELRYQLLKLIQENPNVSQRQLAHNLGISLGKVNYCLGALIEKGLLKVRNFRKSPNKLRYLYKLTPRGVEEKARVTYRFLKQRLQEIEVLQREIEEMRKNARSR